MNSTRSDDLNPDNPFLREVFDGSPEMQAVILALLESHPGIIDDILDFGNDLGKDFETIIESAKRLDHNLNALLEAHSD